jgi:23S rRNA (adenine2503-C2)-methyltransferase
VSTSGVVNLIKKCSEELGVEIAISLHATTNELRDYLVPLNKTFPIEVLFDTLRSLNTKNEITFEYVMLDNVNDFMDDAKRLHKLLKGLKCSVNLIAFNEWEGSGFTCSSEERMNKFSEYLYSQGIAAPIRFSKGQDIDAACGQLKSSEKFKETYLKRLMEQNQQNVKIM